MTVTRYDMQIKRQTPLERTRAKMADIAYLYGVTLADVVGMGCDKNVVAARSAVIRALRHDGWPIGEIGRLLGGRDDSTILLYLRRR